MLEDSFRLLSGLSYLIQINSSFNIFLGEESSTLI
jgi:hypothetical protein